VCVWNDVVFHEELKTERAEDLIKENLIKEILKAISVVKKNRGAEDSW
jgi:hypothetical protein